LALDESTVAKVVLETGRPGRIDTFPLSGSLGRVAHGLGWRSAVAVPVIVEGRPWGTMGVGSMTDRTLPVGTEVRLAEFTELLGLAIANAESREEVTRLAEEQGALRRVATLVAQGPRRRRCSPLSPKR
jgi:GAF domain-containing protein